MCYCGTCYDLRTHNLPVTVQTPIGDIFLETQPSYTIGQVKTMIHENLGMPTKELKLVFADQLLKDGCTLSDYNIQDGATLYIGGMDVYVPLMPYRTSFCPLHLSVGYTLVKVIWRCSSLQWEDPLTLGHLLGALPWGTCKPTVT